MIRAPYYFECPDAFRDVWWRLFERIGFQIRFIEEHRFKGCNPKRIFEHLSPTPTPYGGMIFWEKTRRIGTIEFNRGWEAERAPQPGYSICWVWGFNNSWLEELMALNGCLHPCFTLHPEPEDTKGLDIYRTTAYDTPWPFEVNRQQLPVEISDPRLEVKRTNQEDPSVPQFVVRQHGMRRLLFGRTDVLFCPILDIESNSLRTGVIIEQSRSLFSSSKALNAVTQAVIHVGGKLMTVSYQLNSWKPKNGH